jgi:hypothetical protein
MSSFLSPDTPVTPSCAVLTSSRDESID